MNGFNILIYLYLSYYILVHSFINIKLTNKFHYIFNLKQSINYQSFSDFKCIPTWLINRCNELNFTTPNLVQSTALPIILDGKDVILQSQTGSGKTLVYSLPILSNIDASRAAIQAVIIVPTRELGLQVAGVLKQLSVGSPNKIMIMPLVEGSQNRRQQLWAVADPPHIIVGNPKSLQKLVDTGRLRLNSVSYVVIDEVDACLNNINTRLELHNLLSRKLSNTFKTGEEDSMENIQESLVYSNLAKNQRDFQSSNEVFRGYRQTIMCSATIPQRQHFSGNCYRNGWTLTLPELIHVSYKDLVPKQVKHEYIECDKQYQWSCLKYLIKTEYNQWMNNQTVSKISNNKLTNRLTNRLANRLINKSNNSKNKFQAMVFIDDDQSSNNNIYTSTDNMNEIISSIEKIINTDSSNSIKQKVELLAEFMPLDQRANSLNSFRNGECAVLLCTGCAARGIDIPNITHVFQLSLPNTVEEYIHRTGRVGRMGKSGKAIVIIQPGSEFVISRYSNEIGLEISKRLVKIKNN